MRWHDLRHSCATVQLAPGVDPGEIIKTLGHSQISLTMSTYAQVIAQSQRKTADLLDERFGT